MTTIDLLHALCINGKHSPTVNLIYNGCSFMSFRDEANIIPHGEFICDQYREELARSKRAKSVRPNYPGINEDIRFTLRNLIILKTAMNLYKQRRIFVFPESFKYAEERTRIAAKHRLNHN